MLQISIYHDNGFYILKLYEESTNNLKTFKIPQMFFDNEEFSKRVRESIGLGALMKVSPLPDGYFGYSVSVYGEFLSYNLTVIYEISALYLRWETN